MDRRAHHGGLVRYRYDPCEPEPLPTVHLDRSNRFWLGSCEASRITTHFLSFHYGLKECDGYIRSGQYWMAILCLLTFTAEFHLCSSSKIWKILKVLNNQAPSELNDLILLYHPIGALHSQAMGLLVAPRVLKSRNRAFIFLAPLLWNQTDTLSTFKA